ncbi:MAG: helix-turn-helix domain-containing protein [Ruminococcaceae bacterium]|nr:helix-turn-helix domain-containing protein [Oscillospiraceae bacterium]
MQLLDTELNIVKIQDVKKIETFSSFVSNPNRPTDCFLYVLSGSAYYTIQGKTTKVEKGNVIFFSRTDAYSAEIPSDGLAAIYVNFFLEDTKKLLRNEIFTPQNFTTLESSFEKLNALWAAGNFSDRIYCKSLMYRIYSELARQMQYKYIPSNRKDRIESTIQFMIENFSDANFSVEQLGPMCNMSQVHFRRIFSQIYHTTPIVFLNSLRLNKAKELLLANRLSISEIAAQCGFNSTYYFSKKFKEDTGLTPSTYRKS